MAMSRRAVLGGFATTVALPAFAKNSRRIRIVQPYAAGGSGEMIGRIIMDGVAQLMDATIFIESKAGAGGNLAAATVARAKPDGTTLLLGATNNYAINQFLYKGLPFDTETAFKPISIIVDIPNVFFTNPQTGAKTLRKFVELAKAKPGRFNYGSPSLGTTPHLGSELFSREAGIEMQHVPFRDGVIVALMRNDIQFYSVGFGTFSGFVRSNEIVPLAVAAPKRLAVAPEVETTAEAGYPQVLVNNWWGLSAPVGTPDSFCEEMSQAIQSVTAQESISSRLHELGFVPLATTPKGMTERIRVDSARWSTLIKELNIQLG